MKNRLFKYYCSICLTILLFFGLLFFGLNQAEKNINQLAGIDTPPRSFALELDMGKNLLLTFGGNRVILSLPAVLKTCIYPGVLVHTVFVLEKN